MAGGTAPPAANGRVLALPEMVRDLVQAQRQTGEHLTMLAEAQRRTEECVSRMGEELIKLAEAQRRTVEEFYDVLRLDLLVCGQPRLRPEVVEIWLAGEISAVVDKGDVERTRWRVGHLRRAVVE